ncbi:hypothetical protein SAMN02745178_00069 [Gemmiger formicilis]|uniref:Uncharacterized protein n=1 Tax=Gemmiger formicilis TaxID=745368 RepID=A0A1T4W6R8_9FIRM|nr:hypothetical protein SAMN02745178_00069 [Gemmiger formicilis]
MRETASDGMALSPTDLLAEGLVSLCEGGVRGADGGRELAGIAIFPFIEKSGRIYEKHLWKCRQYDDFW